MRIDGLMNMQIENHGSTDSAYIDRVNIKMGHLERYEVKTRQDINQTSTNLSRMSYDLKQEMEELRSEITSLQIEVKHTIDKIKKVIDEFRKTVKKGDLSRLQSRVDAWNPDNKITRNQFKTLASEDF